MGLWGLGWDWGIMGSAKWDDGIIGGMLGLWGGCWDCGMQGGMMGL